MIVTTDFLAATYKGFQVLFNKSYGETAPELTELVQETSSERDTEVYEFPMAPPQVSQRKDERTISDMAVASFELKNLKFDAGIGVDEDALADEKLSMIRPQIEEMAVSAKMHPAMLIHQLIRDGDSKLCWDGQNFFDTDHKYPKTEFTQSNILTGTGVAIDKLEDDWGSVCKHFLTLKDNRGNPMYLQPNVVVCPADLRQKFNKLFTALQISGTTNVLVAQAKPYANAWLTDPNDWYAAVGGRPSKPFILQWRERFILDQLIEGPDRFKRGQIYYGVKGRYNVGYSQWQLMCKVTNT